MAKKKGDDNSKNKEIELKEFKATNEAGKKIKISAPVDSLDDDGHAEEALQGVLRSC